MQEFHRLEKVSRKTHTFRLRLTEPRRKGAKCDGPESDYFDVRVAERCVGVDRLIYTFSKATVKGEAVFAMVKDPAVAVVASTASGAAAVCMNSSM